MPRPRTKRTKSDASSADDEYEHDVSDYESVADDGDDNEDDEVVDGDEELKKIMELGDDDVVDDDDISIPDSEKSDESVSDSDIDEYENIKYDQKTYTSDSNKHILNRSVIARDDRRTSDRISLFEFVRILESRISQISAGDASYEPISPEILSPAQKAYREVITRNCPLLLVRNITLERVEIWSPNEMILPKETAAIEKILDTIQKTSI